MTKSPNTSHLYIPICKVVRRFHLPLVRGGLYGVGLRRVSGKRLSDATGVVRRAKQTTCLKLQSEHQQPKSWECYWKNIKQKVCLLKNILSSDQAQYCLISSIFFSVYTQKITEAPNEGHAEEKGKVKEVGTVNFWNRWREEAVCQRSTRGGLESPGCTTDLAQSTWVCDPLILLSNYKWHTARAWVALCGWKGCQDYFWRNRVHDLHVAQCSMQRNYKAAPEKCWSLL